MVSATNDSSAHLTKLIWLVVSTNPSEKYEFVSWDDDIPIYMMEKQKNVPNHQPVLDDEVLDCAS